MIDSKDKTNELFKYLRKEHKLLARQNYLCCGSCASHGCASDLKPKHKGWVTYNRQTAESAFDGRRMEGTLYLSYASAEGTDETDTPAPATTWCGSSSSPAGSCATPSTA